MAEEFTMLSPYLRVGSMLFALALADVDATFVGFNFTLEHEIITVKPTVRS